MCANSNNGNLHEVLNSCAWCQKKIHLEDECYEVGARVVQGYDLSKKQGSTINIALVRSQRVVSAIVPMTGSQAARNSDISFMLCSMECGLALKEALNKENAIIDRVNN